MITSLSKYFSNPSELDHHLEDKSKYSDEQKTLESLRTNNILKKLRKIDSTENILNLVQITEYKRNGKSRQSKNKSRGKKNIDDSITVTAKEHTTIQHTAKDIISSIESKAISQQSLTKVSRKEKAENINILGKLNNHNDRESSYESCISDKNLERENIEKLNMGYLGKSNDIFDDQQKEHLGKEKEIKDENTNLKNDDKEVHTIQSSKSTIEVKHNRSISQVNQTELEEHETDLMRTKSSLTLTKVSKSLFEYGPQIDLCRTYAKHGPSIYQGSKSQLDFGSSNNNIAQKYSRRFSKEDITIAKLSFRESEQNIKTLENTQSQQKDLNFNNFLKVHTSVEKFINLVNLEYSDTDVRKRDNSEETAILFTRKSCSNDSVCSKSNNSFENSKIPVLTRLTPSTHQNTPSLEKTKLVMEKTLEQCKQDKEKVISENTPIIHSVVQQSSKNEQENNCDLVVNNTVPTLQETSGRAENIIPTKETKDKIVKKEESSAPKQSKKNVPLRIDAQKQTKTCIKSKVSIFNSSTTHERNQKTTLPIYPKRKFARPKETISRTPLTLTHSRSTYKNNTSSVPLISQTKQQNYFQKSRLNLTQKSKPNLHFSNKPDSIDSHKNVLKAKLSTIKRAQSNKSDLKTSSPLRKKQSVPKVKSESVNEKQIKDKNIDNQVKEQKMDSEIKKCRDLKKEIMQKIDAYEQSVKKVYEIKNEFITKSGELCTSQFDECFINDETITMISKVNAVEHIRLKEQCLTESNGYVKNVTQKVTEELRKYYEYVQHSMNELHNKRNNPTDIHNNIGTKDIEEIIKDTNKQLDSKGKEIESVIIQAFSNMTTENQSLNNYCKELIRTNDECNEKLMEKLVWLEKENENLSTQIFSLKRGSNSNKTLFEEMMDAKKKDEQYSEILKIYNDIEMKNKYHAQLVENFSKSVKMIENKIENHNKVVASKVEMTTSQMEIAEKKRHEMEEIIDQLKQRLENNRQEYQELVSKLNDFQKNVIRLKNKNKILTKELLRYKYPIHLEKNIQKMISLRNMLVDIVPNSEGESSLPFQDNQLLDMMQSISSEVLFPMLHPAAKHTNETPSKASNECSLVRDHGESMSNDEMDG